MRCFIAFLSVFIFTASGFCGDKIVAVVNNQVITEKEVSDYLEMVKLRLSLEYKDKDKFNHAFDREKKTALDGLIEDRLVVEEARKMKIQVPPELVNKRLDQFISGFKYKEDFENSLMKRGLSISALKKKIEDKIMMNQVINSEVKSKIEVAPYEVTNFYFSHKKYFMSSQGVRYKAFKFLQKTKALQVYRELKKDRDTSIIADKYKDALMEGVLYRDKVRDEFKGLLLLKKGEVSEPIGLGGEFYVFLIEEDIPAEQRSLDQVKTAIWNALYQDKFNKSLSRWLDKLKSKAVIKKLPSSKINR